MEARPDASPSSREGESTGSWTLKLPSDSRGAALERTEMSWSGSRDTIPGGVTDIVRGVIRREALEKSLPSRRSASV